MKTNWPAKRHGFLFLASVALMASPLLAQSPLLGTSVPGNTLPAAAPATVGAESNSLPAGVIVGVGLTNDGQRTLVCVNAAGQVTYRVSRMHNPDRLVLDFTGARIGTGKTTIPSELAPVRAVRLGQFKPEIARVVIDLAGAAPYSVQRDGKAVVVVFASEETVPQVTTASARNGEPAKERAAEFKFNTVSHAVRPRRSALHQASSVPIPKRSEERRVGKECTSWWAP